MAREKVFFKEGLFEKSFMRSRVTSEEMTMKEKLLGFLIGPFGTLALIAVINQLAELYYTEIFYVDEIFGVGTYLVMSWVVKVVSMLAGLAVAYIIEHSVSSQGKIRPIILIGSVLCALGGLFMFLIPDMPDIARLIWVYAANILYNGIGVTMFNLRLNMLTLCTRNQTDRNQIALIDRISGYLVVGTAVTLTVGSWLYYVILHGHAAGNWILLVGVMAAVSLPLSMIQYLYTRERLTPSPEEIEGSIYNNSEGGFASIWDEFKKLFRSKYFVMAFGLLLITNIAGNMQGYNLNTNFCTVILGATAENNYNLFYTIAGGIPMGLGILIIYPLSKKFTIRKTTMGFAIVAVAGCLLGYIAKTAFIPAVASSFIFNMGTLPVIYILNALIYAANDEVEYKYNFRPEGTVALAISTSIITIVSGVFAGVYETGLSAFGYSADLGMAQTGGVINWIYFAKYGVPAIEYIIIFAILIFMNLEEKLPKMQEEIEARKQEP